MREILSGGHATRFGKIGAKRKKAFGGKKGGWRRERGPEGGKGKVSLSWGRVHICGSVTSNVGLRDTKERK